MICGFHIWTRWLLPLLLCTLWLQSVHGAPSWLKRLGKGNHIRINSYDHWKADIDAMEKFQSWLSSNRTLASDRVIALAKKRRQAMIGLIQHDPKSAVQFHYQAQQELRTRPVSSVVAEYMPERTYEGKGTVYVACAMALNGLSTHIQDSYQVTFRPFGSRHTYNAYLYGMAHDLATAKLVVHGILDDETSTAALWPGASHDDKGSDDASAILSYKSLNSGTSYSLQASNSGSPSFGSSSTSNSNRVGHGRRILVVHIDFEDAPGMPIPKGHSAWNIDSTMSLMESEVNPFFVQNSYDKLSFVFDYYSEIARMPRPLSYYSSSFANYNQLFSDVESAVSFDDSVYDSFMGLHTKMGGAITFSGLGYVSQPGVLSNGEFNIRVLCHELGHNLGSWHANSWAASNPVQVNSNSYIEHGRVIEYADQFAAMGVGDSTGHRHFSARTKQHYGWIPDSKVLAIQQSGRYQLWAHDNIASLSAETLILRVRVGSSMHKLPGLSYDIEYRNLPVQEQAADSTAVLIRYTLDPAFGFTLTTCKDGTTISDDCDSIVQSNGLTIDMTPTSIADKNGYYDSQDGPLNPDSYFSDYDTKLHIRVSGPLRTTQIDSQMISIIYGTNNCWGNGILQDGQCLCFTGFDGVDCSGTNDANCIVRIYDPNRMLDGLALAEQLMYLLQDDSITFFMQEADGQTGIVHLKFTNSTNSRLLSHFVAKGDKEYKALQIMSVQQGDVMTSWPYLYGKGNKMKLPKWSIYLLAALAVILVVLCALLCVYLARRQKKKHLIKSITRSISVFDMYSDKKMATSPMPFTSNGKKGSNWSLSTESV